MRSQDPARRGFWAPGYLLIRISPEPNFPTPNSKQPDSYLGFPMFPNMETLIPEFSMLPIFLSIFCLVYLTGYFAVFRDWSPKHRPDATSCFISLAHGSLAAILALYANLSQSFDLASANTKSQNLVLDFSIAYFTVDLIHYLVFLPPGSCLFIAHHLATLFVFVTCRYLVLHGAFSILVFLVLAEVTSACQNIWTLAGLRRSEIPFAARIYESLSPPFYALYTLMRVILGPLFFFKMSAFYLCGGVDDVIPRWVSVSWILVVGGAISVSIMWISNLWMELYMERNPNGDKKER